MVECLLAKEDVASSSLVSRSIKKIRKPLRLFFVSGVYVMKQMQKYLYFALLALFFLLGLTLRAKLYIASNVFSDDECRLVLSILNKNIWESFLFLGSAQSAPPLFIFCTKMITAFFGFSEHAAKFIPFVSSVAAIYFFYKCCTQYFKKNYTRLAAVFIFAICQPLIAFSSIFKQYSTDVLIACICLYYFPKIKEFDRKKLIITGVGICILPFISLPSLFFIGAFLLKNFKNTFKLLLPLAATMILYYFFNLAPAKLDLDTHFPNYWNDGFFGFSFSDFLRFLVLNIKFYFVPNTFSLPAIILFIWGICLFIREKCSYILLSLLLVFMAAFMHIYPLSGRVGLYFIPVMIIFMLKPLETGKWIAVAVVLVFFSFCKYDLNYMKNITTFDYFVSCSPKNLLEVIKDKFNPKKDIVLCNSASTPSYLFYSNKLGFYTDNIFEMPLTSTEKEAVFHYLNGLQNGKGYWFYLVKDYNNFRLYPQIFEWLKGENVKYSFNERDSYLFYVEK